MSRSILITGATGNQGGATLHNLLGKGFTLRAMTRKPEGEKARALANAGVEIVRGDLDDAESLKKALAGVWGVYETGIPHFENKSRWKTPSARWDSRRPSSSGRCSSWRTCCRRGFCMTIVWSARSIRPRVSR